MPEPDEQEFTPEQMGEAFQKSMEAEIFRGIRGLGSLFAGSGHIENTPAPSTDNDLDSTQIGAVALAYYLYRQAGCPRGKSHAAFEGWFANDVAKPYDDFCEKETGLSLGAGEEE